jgi:hypothetical protein
MFLFKRVFAFKGVLTVYLNLDFQEKRVRVTLKNHSGGDGFPGDAHVLARLQPQLDAGV